VTARKKDTRESRAMLAGGLTGGMKTMPRAKKNTNTKETDLEVPLSTTQSEEPRAEPRVKKAPQTEVAAEVTAEPSAKRARKKAPEPAQEPEPTLVQVAPKARKPRQPKSSEEPADLGLRDGLPHAQEKQPKRTGRRKKVAIEVPYTRDEVLTLLGILKDAEMIAANDIEVCRANLGRFEGNAKATEALNKTISICQDEIKQFKTLVAKTADLESKMPL